jgi:hypothetical protein
MIRIAAVVIGTVLCLLSTQSYGDRPPIPIGYDAYRQWDKWHVQRVGMRTYMRSTYDRRGGNEGADASHFLYQLADDNNITLDVVGAGILAFVRTNHWHGSPWRYVIDGKEHIVSETSTKDPDHPVENSTFLPEPLFPKPLAWTWSTTKGADLNWVPMPFEKSLRLGYSRTRYGTGYYIFQQFVPGTPLSQPLKAWDRKTGPPKDVLELLARAGTDIAPRPATPEGRRLAVEEISGRLDLRTGESSSIASLRTGPTLVRALEFSAPRSQAVEFGRSRLRITWDDRADASVDAPLALFFGAGTLYNRDNREYLVKAFPVNIRYDAERVTLACYFPMPFARSARVEVYGTGTRPITDVRWSLCTQPLKEPFAECAYFHATYQDHPRPTRGQDLVLLNTLGVEGSAQWSGHFVGTSWIFSRNANLGTLEGDPRFFFDGSESPQAYGTGTEEWGGGGDYWGGLNMTLPFAGHPTGARSFKEALNEEDKIESAYRFLLGDLMPFGNNARIQLEHGGTNESTEHYETVTYWYGAPKATLVKTDELRFSDPGSVESHGYTVVGGSEPYVLTSRFELEVDSAGGSTTYPLRSETARKMTGQSEFMMKLDPKNVGVMLRRRLDYSYPNQRAEVFVADTSGSPWRRAGTWYTAGSNTCIYSNPPQELGKAQHIVQTSNRRFREDEFLLPLALTKGRSAIRIRIKFTPANLPLFPGYPLPEQAWSEIRYSAFCFKRP